MIYFILTGTIIAYLLGRFPHRIFDNLRFRYPAILIGALGVQIVLFVVFRLNPVHYAYLLEITLLLLVAGLWFNKNFAGIKWIILGTLFNMSSLLVHQGRMPVMKEALKIARLPYTPDDARHQLMNGQATWWLGDWIPLFKAVISIGDVFVGIGVILFLIYQSPSRSSL